MYLTANEAAGRLGVSRATLYAYVSRGLVRSRAKAGVRQRQYLAADIEALVQRKRSRADPAVAASEALGFGGLPVLESALSSVEGGRLRYRGRDAVALAQGATLEEVAALLWDGPYDEGPMPTVSAAVQRTIARLPLVPAMHTWLASAGAADPAALNLTADSVRRTGAKILRGLAAVAAGLPRPHDSIAKTLIEGWQPRGTGVRRRIEAALVLCADHELNVSAFTARCVASAHSHPYMVVTAALAALMGHRHGGETERVAALGEEGPSPREVIAARLRRGDRVPGFGHPLYPEGDPRGRMLLSLARPGAAATRWRAVAEAGRQLLAAEPTLDLGLVSMSQSMGLPADAPMALFAIGRTVGWVAHALEQYPIPSLIRPRARYVGTDPVD